VGEYYWEEAGLCRGDERTKEGCCAWRNRLSISREVGLWDLVIEFEMVWVRGLEGVNVRISTLRDGLFISLGVVLCLLVYGLHRTRMLCTSH
jgi:hypothetical protein